MGEATFFFTAVFTEASIVRALYAQRGHRIRYRGHIPYARSIDHVRLDAYHMRMNEQVVRIVTSQTTTTFVQVQDAVTDPGGNVLVPPRLQAVPQPMLYQVAEPLPSPDGAPQEPLHVISIIESYDEESGELIEYEVYSVGDKGSVYERTNRAVVTRVPASEVIRKDCRVYGDEMALALQEYARSAAEQQQQQQVPTDLQAQQPAPQQQPATQQQPSQQYIANPNPQPSSGTGQAPPHTVGGMADVEMPPSGAAAQNNEPPAPQPSEAEPPEQPTPAEG